ncbi:hypothetical protein DID88_001166 [Monilinia fructigena]|uniref:Uncharacterized protein n=1 Tax=Monilinia fructigena TaxID=38457 RepID=A0A395J325_9HELO|nr:hypothetical protein DID88_001166 [Monilinia fructigena]
MRTYANSLLTPVIQPATAVAAPLGRTTKRGTTAINYAEDGYDYEEDEDDENKRRPTGLRSLRREDIGQAKQDPSEKVGREATAPVEVQGIWRDWMSKGRPGRTDIQNYGTSRITIDLDPIRIDLDILLLYPLRLYQFCKHPSLPYNRYLPPGIQPQEMTVPYRLKDVFLWNLHETFDDHGSIRPDHGTRPGLAKQNTMIGKSASRSVHSLKNMQVWLFIRSFTRNKLQRQMAL